MRKGVIELCRSISGLSGVKDFAMTTNGLLLPEMAMELKAARINAVEHKPRHSGSR